MPNHAALTGANLHEAKGLDTATTADAGKVLTPSSVTSGVSTLRKLKATELNSEGDNVTDAGKTLHQSSVTDELFVLRYTTPDDVDNLECSMQCTLTDIGTAATKYIVATGTIDEADVYVILQGAITGTDETVTVDFGDTNVVLTVLVAGSGVGVITSDLANTITTPIAKGALITVTTAGNSTGATEAIVQIIGRQVL